METIKLRWSRSWYWDLGDNWYPHKVIYFNCWKTKKSMEVSFWRRPVIFSPTVVLRSVGPRATQVSVLFLCSSHSLALSSLPSAEVSWTAPLPSLLAVLSTLTPLLSFAFSPTNPAFSCFKHPGLHSDFGGLIVSFKHLVYILWLY